MSLEESNKSIDRREIRYRINKLRKGIKRRLTEIAEHKAEQLSKDITKTDDSRKMFEAVRTLHVANTSTTITVHNKDGQCIGTDEPKAKAVRAWFMMQSRNESPRPH